MLLAPDAVLAAAIYTYKHRPRARDPSIFTLERRGHSGEGESHRSVSTMDSMVYKVKTHTEDAPASRQLLEADE